MRRFFGLPTRGGCLTILNAFLWLMVFSYAELGYRGNPPDAARPILLCTALALSLPLTPCFLSGFRTHSRGDLLELGILIAANAFLWGYGLSYLLTHLHRLRPANLRAYFFPDLTPIDHRPPPPPPTCPTCGYDTRATPARCPECGTTLPPPGPPPR